MSNREHAKRTGAGHPLVGRVREELERSEELEQCSSRISGDGRERPASQPPREPEPVTDIISHDDLDELNHPERTSSEPRVEAITSQFTSAIADLNRVLNKFHRITSDKNYPRNKDMWFLIIHFLDTLSVFMKFALVESWSTRAF
ncbi:hypothetical protein [Corynebacterium striatum]|uniref:hypothetical protein n=1 Tax=Corynebacterium striatum TaxID=43770 RepID=UPI0034D452AB